MHKETGYFVYADNYTHAGILYYRNRNGEVFTPSGWEMLESPVEFPEVQNLVVVEEESEPREEWKGKVISAQFADGEDWNECEDEDCFCPNHEQRVLPAGTYVTVKLDEDYRVGCFPVTIFPETRK